MTLTSDDLLLNDPTLGRCFLCQWLVKLDTMTEIHLDSRGNVVDICEECVEKEGSR